MVRSLAVVPAPTPVTRAPLSRLTLSVAANVTSGPETLALLPIRTSLEVTSKLTPLRVPPNNKLATLKLANVDSSIAK